MDKTQNKSDNSLSGSSKPADKVLNATEVSDTDMEESNFYTGPVPTFHFSDACLEDLDSADNATDNNGTETNNAKDANGGTNATNDTNNDDKSKIDNLLSPDGSQPNSRKVSRASHASNVSDSSRNPSQPGSRKISFLTEAGHVAAPPHIYLPLAHNRKISSVFYGDAPSRKVSMEAFHHQPYHKMSRAGQKISVFSIGNMSDTGTIHGDWTECLPSLDNYRDYIEAEDIRLRPTLFQLRQDSIVSSL